MEIFLNLAQWLLNKPEKTFEGTHMATQHNAETRPCLQQGTRRTCFQVSLGCDWPTPPPTIDPENRHLKIVVQHVLLVILTVLD